VSSTDKRELAAVSSDGWSGRGGFTLVEVLLVVLILGVLAMVALPGYQQQQLNTRRSVATSALEALRAQQEQFFINNRRYAADLTTLGFASSPYAINAHAESVPLTAADRIYTVTIDSVTATSFTLRAVSQLVQAQDRQCAALTLTSAGVRGASPGTVGDCW